VLNKPVQSMTEISALTATVSEPVSWRLRLVPTELLTQVGWEAHCKGCSGPGRSFRNWPFSSEIALLAIIGYNWLQLAK